MRARDQSSIFSIGGKFCPDYGLLLELHALTLVARSYALLITVIARLLGIYGNVNRPCPRASPSDSGRFTAINP